MESFNDVLGDGAVLHVTKAEWLLRYDRSPTKLDGTKDLRYNPDFSDLKREDIECYIENILPNWEEAEKIMNSLPPRSQFINKTLPGSMRVQVNDKTISLYLRHGKIISTREEATYFSNKFKEIYHLARNQQLELFADECVKVPDKNKVEYQLDICLSLASKIEQSPNEYGNTYKFYGVQIAEAKRELLKICENFKNVDIKVYRNNRHTELLKIIVSGSPEPTARDFLNALMKLWEETTCLFAQAIVCSGWVYSLPEHWWVDTQSNSEANL